MQRMALVPCADCGNQISSSALACPKCGKPMMGFLSGRFVKRALILWGVLIFAFLVIWQVLNTQGRAERRDVPETSQAR